MDKEVLSGIRVLDITRYRAGPTCGQILGDMGAEVIRIERPGGEDDGRLEPFPAEGRSYYLTFLCRNKKNITLNLREPKGKGILKDLVKQSDVVLENFGPGTNKRLGVDYQSLRQIKEDIIVTSVSGFGQYGPYANKFCYDGVAQAMSGFMWVTGFPEGLPVKAGVSFTDTATGIYGALGTMFALYHRQRTGEGQLVDVCLFDTAISFMETYLAEFEMAHQVHLQIGNCHPYAGPVDAYKAKDGYFFVHIVGSAVWGRFLKMMGREELASDPRFETDYKRSQPEIRQFFADWLNKWGAAKTVAEIVEQFNQAGVPCGPVNTIPQVVADPHIRAREMIVEVEHPEVGKVPLIGIPIKLSKTPGTIKTTAPTLGEHNQEIYCSLLGYTNEEFNELTQKGII
jgi:crotonobetainyl-CoA:carnitine CoA-transferase CaiB-like acyl-CoA transferase